MSVPFHDLIFKGFPMFNTVTIKLSRLKSGHSWNLNVFGHEIFLDTLEKHSHWTSNGQDDLVGCKEGGALNLSFKGWGDKPRNWVIG